MDQVAGPIVASLDQPADSVVDGPAGAGTDDPLLGLDEAILGVPATDELGPHESPPSPLPPSPLLPSPFLSSSPPAPAWLLRRPVRRTSRTRAILALTAMLLLATALGVTAVNLALKGIAGGPASDQAAAPRPLLWPPPPTAGGLPLHSPVVGNKGTRRVIAQFRRRFEAALPGQAAAYPAAAYPAALYNEPGRVDLTTNTPGWVMYAGFNEPRRLADPVAAVGTLMADLAGPSGNVRPWTVSAGPAGGTARCVVAIVGLTQVAVCGWATDTTIGAILSPTRDTSVTELAVLMGLMRPDLQPG
jgi:hypothetical protein